MSHCERSGGEGEGCSPVEVVEEAGEPPHHDLVVLPSLQQLLQEKLVPVVLQRWKHLAFIQQPSKPGSQCILWCESSGWGRAPYPLRDVLREGIPVAVVEGLAVVVGRFLCAHVVDCPAPSSVRFAHARVYKCLLAVS